MLEYCQNKKKIILLCKVEQKIKTQAIGLDIAIVSRVIITYKH